MNLICLQFGIFILSSSVIGVPLSKHTDNKEIISMNVTDYYNAPPETLRKVISTIDSLISHAENHRDAMVSDVTALGNDVTQVGKTYKVAVEKELVAQNNAKIAVSEVKKEDEAQKLAKQLYDSAVKTQKEDNVASTIKVLYEVRSIIANLFTQSSAKYQKYYGFQKAQPKNACPPGMEITAEEDCARSSKLATLLNLIPNSNPMKSHVNGWPAIPYQCSVQVNAQIANQVERYGKLLDHDFWWNNNAASDNSRRLTGEFVSICYDFGFQKIMDIVCPSGMEITTKEDCERANMELNPLPNRLAVGAFPNLPYQCSAQDGVYNWNTIPNSDKTKSQKVAVICKKRKGYNWNEQKKKKLL